jgi:hypothetical protein
MQPIYFNKAGKLMLNKYVDGVPVRTATTSYFRNGVVQSIQPSATINTSPIADGNSMWPAANPDTSIEGSVTVTLGFMPAELYAFIMGDTTQELTNEPMPEIDYEIVIPEASPFAVTLPNAPDLTRSIILVGSDASAWAKTASVSAVPTTGQYTVSAAAVVFNSADAGKPVFITYDYTASTVTNFGLPKTPKRANYELVVVGEATGEDNTLYKVVTTVDNSKVIGQIPLPTQGGTPQPITLTFSVQKPRGQKRAVDYKATPITA